MYESDYESVDVYKLDAAQFAEAAKPWREQLVEAYRNPRNQRFRRSIPYRKVYADGRIVMKIRDGRLMQVTE